MVIGKDLFEYLDDGMNYLDIIGTNVTGFENEIYVFNNGIERIMSDKILKFKSVPKVIIYDISKDKPILVIIIGASVIPLAFNVEKYSRELEYIKQNREMFVKQYKAEHVYGYWACNILCDILDGTSFDEAYSKYEDKYYCMRELSYIYYDEFDGLENDIFTLRNIKILDNGKLYRVRFNKKITKAYILNPFIAKKCKNTIDFINKNIDIFRWGIMNKCITSIGRKLREQNL